MSERQITRGEYEAINAVVDGVDEVARQQEEKWGVGRLELLVSDELREKFRRQLRRFNEAIEAHDVERVRQAGWAMRRGWEVLDKAAAAAGAAPLDPEVWEVRLPGGRIAAVCRGGADAFAATRSGRWLEVWTLEEFARVVENFPMLALAKQTFPGALIEDIRPKRASEQDDEPVEEGV